MMMRSSGVLCLVVVAAVLAHSQTISTRPARPQPGRFDPAIRTAIDQYLQNHKEFAQVQSQVDAGMVTLTGKVPLFRDRKAIINYVLRLPHVETVRDQVELADAPISDKLLMGRLAERLKDLMPEGANYQVHEGRVRLAGKIRDQALWSKIITIVDTTPGVQEVEDRLTIAEQEKH
jgi:osmotically-inducible protein OsmY